MELSRSVPESEKHSAAIAAACELLAAAAPPLAEVARAVGMSPYHFHRVFKAATGLTPRKFAAAQRAERVRDTLARDRTVTRAIYDAGFNSNARFYAEAPAILGMSPRAFRDAGAGETIRFAVAPCALGLVLVGATERGVCAVALGADQARLESDLRQRFRNARILPQDRRLRAWVQAIVRQIESPAPRLTLPLDVRGTVFQQRVWQALAAIPSGATASYREIARRLGTPQSARAVARACASNPLAVLIPCHRAVRSDGGISGYRWGIERKQALLERERAAAARKRRRATRS